MDGIVSSSVGYTGGTKPNPTYRSVCSGDGHTEAVRLVYDPKVISYEELITKILAEASPHRSKAQYMSAVWATDEHQAVAAKKVAAQLNKSQVPILASAATTWYDAEEYHQKYVEKSQGGGAACGRGGSLAAKITGFGSL